SKDKFFFFFLVAVTQLVIFRSQSGRVLGIQASGSWTSKPEGAFEGLFSIPHLLRPAWTPGLAGRARLRSSRLRHGVGPGGSAGASFSRSRSTSLADLAVAVDDPLGAGQLAEAAGASGVELVGADADLGAEAKLAAVVEPGAG